MRNQHVTRPSKFRWLPNRKPIFLIASCVLALAASVYTALPARSQSLPANTRIDFIVVEKAKRTMSVYAGEKLLKTYRIALGQQPVGAKQVQGDMKTPEGRYFIDGKNPNSQYHKNLGVSYPSAKDRAHAKKLGKPPGGDIKIHGLPNGMPDIGSAHALHDWTWGCIAVTNEEIDELYKAVTVRTIIDIKP